jgi:hypothetical protein
LIGRYGLVGYYIVPLLLMMGRSPAAACNGALLLLAAVETLSSLYSKVTTVLLVRNSESGLREEPGFPHSE